MSKNIQPNSGNNISIWAMIIINKSHVGEVEWKQEWERGDRGAQHLANKYLHSPPALLFLPKNVILHRTLQAQYSQV